MSDAPSLNSPLQHQEMVASNIVLARNGRSLYIIQRREPWRGRGALYLCSYSSVLLTIAVWNVLTFVFGLIILVIGVDCLRDRRDKGCAQEQVWVALFIVWGLLQVASLMFTCVYGGPYFRDTVFEIHGATVARYHFWPRPQWLCNASGKGGFRTGRASISLTPQDTLDITQDYEIKGGGASQVVHKLVMGDAQGRELAIGSPNMSHATLQRLKLLVEEQLGRYAPDGHPGK